MIGWRAKRSPSLLQPLDASLLAMGTRAHFRSLAGLALSAALDYTRDFNTFVSGIAGFELDLPPFSAHANL
jgi:hypothetical protein